jgi:hypothetical protein
VMPIMANLVIGTIAKFLSLVVGEECLYKLGEFYVSFCQLIIGFGSKHISSTATMSIAKVR